MYEHDFTWKAKFVWIKSKLIELNFSLVWAEIHVIYTIGVSVYTTIPWQMHWFILTILEPAALYWSKMWLDISKSEATVIYELWAEWFLEN